MEPHCYQPLVGKKTSLEDSAEPIASSQGGTGTPACLQYPTESSTDQDQDCSLQRRAHPAVCRDTLLSPGAPGTVCCTLTDGPGYFTQHQQMNTRASLCFRFNEIWYLHSKHISNEQINLIYHIFRRSVGLKLLGKWLLNFSLIYNLICWFWMLIWFVLK